jgi:hypothetical protein
LSPCVITWLGCIRRSDITIGRLALHNSSVSGVTRTGGTTARAEAPRIATIAAALLLDRVIPSTLLLLTDELTHRHGRCSWLQPQSCFQRLKWPAAYHILPRARYKDGCWPDWASEAAKSLCHYLHLHLHLHLHLTSDISLTVQFLFYASQGMTICKRFMNPQTAYDAVK